MSASQCIETYKASNLFKPQIATIPPHCTPADKSPCTIMSWLQSAVTTLACYVSSVMFLPIGRRPMCRHSYFCLLDVLHCNACHIFHHRCGIACFLCAMHVFDIWASSLLLFVPNFVSLMAPIAKLAHGEKSHTQSINHSVTHPAFLMCREPKLSLRNKCTA